MKTKFEINGVSLEYDFLDADKMEAYENMLTELYAQFEAEGDGESESYSVQLRRLCGYIKDGLSKIFDNVEEFLPGNNYGECLEAIATLTEASKNASKNLNAYLVEKRSEQPNRDARRRNKKRRH